MTIQLYSEFWIVKRDLQRLYERRYGLIDRRWKHSFPTQRSRSLRGFPRWLGAALQRRLRTASMAWLLSCGR